MYLSIFVSVYLSIYLSVYLSIHLSIYLSIYTCRYINQVKPQVRISAEWVTRPDNSPDAILSVNLIGAADLPPMSSAGFIDPFVVTLHPTASTREGNILKRFKDFDLQAKARIWP